MSPSGDIASELLDLEARRRRGEAVSEFQSARIHAEFRREQIMDSFKSGVPKSEIAGVLAITARTSKKAAWDALQKVLRKSSLDSLEEFEEQEKVALKAEIQAEVSIKKSTSVPVTPKPDQAPALVHSHAPVVHRSSRAKTDPVDSVIQEVSPAQSGFKISAPAELVEKPAASIEERKPDKWAHLGGNEVIGKGFIGEEHRWMTPEEMQKAKEHREELHRISNAESDKRRGLEQTKKMQKEASPNQPETQPGKE